MLNGEPQLAQCKACAQVPADSGHSPALVWQRQAGALQVWHKVGAQNSMQALQLYVPSTRWLVAAVP